MLKHIAGEVFLSPNAVQVGNSEYYQVSMAYIIFSHC